MIYLMEDSAGRVKIGYSKDRSGVDARLSAMRVGNPSRLRVIAAFDGERADEKRLHRVFAEFRIGGEWFASKDTRSWFHNAITLLRMDGLKILATDISEIREFYFSQALAADGVFVPNLAALRK